MKTKKTIRCLMVFGIGFLCGIVAIMTYNKILNVVKEQQNRYHPIQEAIGFYSWDLTKFYPPGSSEAKEIFSGMKDFFAELKTNRSLYIRLPGPGGGIDTPIVWDFKPSPTLLKKWQKQIMANQRTPAASVLANRNLIELRKYAKEFKNKKDDRGDLESKEKK